MRFAYRIWAGFEVFSTLPLASLDSQAADVYSVNVYLTSQIN